MHPANPQPLPPPPPSRRPVPPLPAGAPARDWRPYLGPAGLGLLLLGLVVFFGGAHGWGLVLAVAGLAAVVVARATDTLRRQQVIDRWDALLVAGHGQAERIVAQTIATLVARQIPQIARHQAELAPGWLRGFAGDTRPFLVVAHTRNPRLKPYKMYVNARDYGLTLQTSWYLAYQPPVWRRVLTTVGPFTPRLDLFDEQDLRAYVTAVHHAFLDAVVEVLAALGQETGTLNRSSKGFLGIS